MIKNGKQYFKQFGSEKVCPIYDIHMGMVMALAYLTTLIEAEQARP